MVEHQAGGVHCLQRQARRRGHLAQKAVRLAEQQAAAVAGLAVGGHGAAVGQLGQRGDGGIDQPMTGFVVELGDQAKAATVLFEIRMVQGALQPALSVHIFVLLIM